MKSNKQTPGIGRYLKKLKDGSWQDDLKMRGMFMMLICNCNHKQHGHQDNIGSCSRCECTKFVERKNKAGQKQRS